MRHDDTLCRPALRSGRGPLVRGCARLSPTSGWPRWAYPTKHARIGNAVAWTPRPARWPCCKRCGSADIGWVICRASTATLQSRWIECGGQTGLHRRPAGRQPHPGVGQGVGTGLHPARRTDRRGNSVPGPGYHPVSCPSTATTRRRDRHRRTASGQPGAMVSAPRGFRENGDHISIPTCRPATTWPLLPLARYRFSNGARCGAQQARHLELPKDVQGMSARPTRRRALGDLPLIYPFLVNDPARAPQAKRRARGASRPFTSDTRRRTATSRVWNSCSTSMPASPPRWILASCPPPADLTLIRAAKMTTTLD